MVDKQPCLCMPSCTKELGQVQRQCHHKRVQAALGHASDSSDAGTSSDLEELPTDGHCASDPAQFYQDDSFPAQDLYDDDVDHPIALNNEPANDDWSGGSSCSDSEQESEGLVPPLIESEDENDAEEEEEVEDEITDENLMQVLEERFGNDWRQQLNILRKCHTIQDNLMSH